MLMDKPHDLNVLWFNKQDKPVFPYLRSMLKSSLSRLLLR